MAIAFFPAADSGSPQFFIWPDGVPLPWGAVAMMPSQSLSFGLAQTKPSSLPPQTVDFFLSPIGAIGVRVPPKQLKPALVAGGLTALGYGVATKSKAE